MGGPAARPVDIELDRASELRIRWTDGERRVYPLSLLRRACPCAACRVAQRPERPSPLPVVAAPEVQQAMATAENVELVGNYGLRITWQDGHKAGIYGFEYLKRLAIV